MNDTAVGPARPARAVALEVAGLEESTTLDVAAVELANQLRGVPGIERFGLLRLAELDKTGPRPLRTMWRIAKGQLDERYGQLTIGELIDRFSAR